MDVKGDTVWCATGYVEETEAAGNVQTGAGYTYSFDNGATWHSAPQPLDAQSDTAVIYGANRIHFLPITVPEQNVTFRVDVTDSAVWVASWSSGLRKSTDNGATWKRTVLPSDSLSSISPNDSLSGYVVDPSLLRVRREPLSGLGRERGRDQSLARRRRKLVEVHRHQ